MDKVFSKIESVTTLGILLLLPFFVVNISSNPYVIPKLILLSFGVGLLLILKSIRTISTGKLDFFIGKYDFPVFLLALSYILSSVFKTPNKMEAYLLPGTTTAVVGGVLLYYLINQLGDNYKQLVIKILVISGGIFSLLMIFAFTGVLGKIPQLPAYIKVKTFSPEGGYLPNLSYLLSLFPLSVLYFLSGKELKNKVISAVSGILIIVGFVISLYNILPGKPFAPRFPNSQISWYIAVDALKESPLLGIGPGNYSSAFNRYRPAVFNNTDIWAVKFSTANNFYFTLFTETGLLGISAIILIVYAFYKEIRKDIKEKSLVNWGYTTYLYFAPLVILLLGLAILPATNLLIILLPLYLALIVKTKKTTLNLTTVSSDTHEAHGFSTAQVVSRFPALVITLPVIITVILIGARSVKIVRAEYKFKQSLESLLQNDAVKTYDLMRTAIQINPQVDRYHSNFSRINMLVANAIAGKKDLTDDDRTRISQLVQQSINSAKATVASNPLRAQNWEILGRTYQTIIPFAKGADSFAAQSYRNAITLDPLNPNARIALGGLFYAAKDYESASRILELAVSVKPDLANTHYNLAFVYRDAGKLDAAITQMTQVLSLINRDAPDYEVARKALEDLQNKKKAEAPSGQELTPPAQAEKPAIQPQLELPEESEPPAVPLTPTPVPAEELVGATPTPGQ